MARALVGDLVAGKFTEAAARFDDKMAQAMPADRLRTVWQQLVSQMGDFKSVTGTRGGTVQGYRVQVVSCQFERGAIDTRITFNDAGRVAGLFFAPAASEAPKPSPLPEGLVERPLTIGEGTDWPLPGTLTRPVGNGRFPAVVLVHGSGPNDRDETIGANAPFRDLSRGLAGRGVAVLRYDKRTRVYGSKLAAGLGSFTVNEETVADARAAVALLAAQPDVDPARIFVLGHSLGGMMVPRIAAGLPALAGGIVMAGNARPLEDLIVEQVEYLAAGNTSQQATDQLAATRETARRIKDPGLKAGEMVTVLGASTPASYWLDLRGYQPAKSAATLNIPLLVLQGGRDYQVRPADFELWKASLANRPGATCKLYPALNHLFIAGSGPSTPAEYATAGQVADEVMADIAAWILARGGKGK
jgi:hypothetical protein